MWEPRSGGGEEERRAAWSRCLLVGGQRTPPSPSLLLSSAFPPAFIGRASKWRSAYEKSPVFMPRKLAYRHPSPTHFTKTPLTSVREGRPSSAGSPLFLPLSPLAVPFSPLNHGCEGRRWRRGGGQSWQDKKRVKSLGTGTR